MMIVDMKFNQGLNMKVAKLARLPVAHRLVQVQKHKIDFGKDATYGSSPDDGANLGTAVI